ncbi:hypothetical protein [Mucilaginibacter ginsenosidivorax]|uniref:Outer membrane protein beta-barrel domain-containing protein n=1 Tax=Mucilaginibacter ginsenosidivorax TaxID=862126 RepID=A0A5B8VYT9_9SPHI|nr:hypothetical protein [Mucilaginibacter ginsenosidivorax]QEC75636.1 hypothetical protein FSB76_06620 [Mucilaginibacter ginsenosidivorax]
MAVKYIRLLILLMFCAASSRVSAQSGNKMSLSIGPDVGIPINVDHPNAVHTRDIYQDGLGGTIRAEFPLTPALHATASVGYVVYHSNLRYLYLTPTQLSNYAGPSNTSSPPPYKYVPLKAGLRYYYVKCLFVSAEAGDALKIGHEAKASFIYSGGAGAAVPFGVHHALDIGFRYESGYKNIDSDFKMGQIGIGFSYKYTF